jgi:hypothetical protein
MDTITKDHLRAEWRAWVSEKDIDFLTEYPGARRDLLAGDIDPERVRCTAYVADGYGYKLFKRSVPDLGQKAVAWRFPVYPYVHLRDAFHRASCILEASPVGLEKLFRGYTPEIDSDKFMFQFGPVERCEELHGPPPSDAEYFEIDWRLRRLSKKWQDAQREAYVFGPERVRHLLRGMRVAGHEFGTDVCEVLEIRHSLLREWLDCGTEYVKDEFVMMDRHRRALPRSRYADRVRPILMLAGYEKFSPAAGYLSVDDALEQ